MMNGEYWARRFELLTDMELNKGEQFYGDLQRQYTKSIRRMQKDASYYLQKMADANGLSMTEARKLLKKDELEEFHWSVEEYIQRGKENAVDQSWMVELQNASTKFHVSRLEALQTQMRAEVEQLTGGQSEDLQKLLEGIYEDDYYRTAFEVQKGTGVGFQMMRLDKRSVEKAVLRPWTTDDQTFSDRLWKNKQTLLNNLQSGLSQAIAQGKNPSEVTDMISQKMGVSKSQAGRLVMTESAFIASSAQKDSFKELGVEEYEVVATLDTKTSDICRAMDGKHFPMSQYQIGVTAPPFHPWCRSTTVPYFDDEFTVGEQRAMRDPKTGDYSTVPSNMKYEDWYKKYVDPDYKGVKLTTPEPTIEDKIKELEGKVADKEAEKKSAESELIQKKQEKTQVGYDLTDVERDIRSAKSNKHDYESGLTSYDKFIRMGDGFDQWYDSIPDELSELEEQIKDIREKMHGLDYDDPDYDEKYEKLFNKRKALRAKREELYEDQLTASEYRVWRKTHKGKDYDKIISDLHDKKTKLIDKDTALGNEIQDIFNHMSSLDADIADIKKEIGKLKLQLKKSNVVTVDIRPTTTKIKAAMGDDVAYEEYMGMVEKNDSIAPLYQYADDLRDVRRVPDGGVFEQGGHIEFDYPKQSYVDSGMSKYHTLAHEHGHYFDTFARRSDRMDVSSLTWSEMDTIKQGVGARYASHMTEHVLSNSDQFLEAMRKDLEAMRGGIKGQSIRNYCLARRNTSCALQDAVDGYGYGRVAWGHGDKYYNRAYNSLVDWEKWSSATPTKSLKAVYQALGFDASNQTKVKRICRQYETASELWANLIAAETTGGEELECCKEVFPETYKTMLEILKGVL